MKNDLRPGFPGHGLRGFASTFVGTLFFVRRQEHELITSGIYRTIRNPCVLEVELFTLRASLIAPAY